LLLITGCDKQLSSPSEVRCYSGGHRIYDHEAIDVYPPSSGSPFWSLTEKNSGVEISISADCVVRK